MLNGYETHHENALQIVPKKRRSKKGEPPDHIDRHVGMKIRRQRILSGISTTLIAESLGMSFQQIQKYEKGINRISASRLYKIASYLGIQVGSFFEDVPITERNVIEERPQTRLVLETSKQLGKLKDRDLKIAHALIHGMTKIDS